MRVRRANEGRKALTLKREIVGVAALAAHEPQVLKPGKRLADIAIPDRASCGV
jgi:hypothetical protein